MSPRNSRNPRRCTVLKDRNFYRLSNAALLQKFPGKLRQPSHQPEPGGTAITAFYDFTRSHRTPSRKKNKAKTRQARLALCERKL